MTQPWGISGPAFAWLYPGCLVLASLAFGLLRALARNFAPARQAPDIDAYELGYLISGPYRTDEVVLAVLLERGALRINRDGQLSVADQTAVTSDDSRLLVEAFAVVTEIGPCSASAACMAIREGKAMGELSERLRQRGLLCDPSRAATIRLVFLLPLLITLTVGVLRLVSGLALGRPVGVLVILMIVAALLFALLWMMAKSSEQPSFAGYAQRRVARSAVQSAKQAQGAAALVATGGLLAYPDPTIAAAMNPAVTSSGYGFRGAGFSSGDFSGGGGGSCGG